MNTIHPLTKILEALPAIQNETVLPVVALPDRQYLVDISLAGRGTLIWTEFDLAGNPVESWQGKYSSYHTFIQLFRNPVPKSKYDEIQHARLPVPPEVLSISQILAGYNT